MKELDKLSSEELLAEVSRVYVELSEATTKYLDAERALQVANHRFEDRYAQGLIEGAISGKNDKEREAVAREIMPDYFQAIEAAQTLVWMHKKAFQLAKLEEAHITLGVRVFEFIQR